VGTPAAGLSIPSNQTKKMKTEIQLPAAELKVALAGLNKVISKRTTLPVLQQVRVTRDERGVVSLHGTDLDVFVSYLAQEFQPGNPVDLLVPFEPLNKAVKSTKGVITITGEKKRVSISSLIGTTPIEETFDTLPVAEWPKAPVLDDPSVALNDAFKASLREALECVGSDGSRQVLTGAHLDVSKPKAHYLVATDAHHLYASNSFAFDLKTSLTIPSSRFLTWPEFSADGDWCACARPAKDKEPGYVQINSNRWQFITKLIDEPFPNWRNVVPEENRPGTTVELTEEAVATLLQIIPRLPGQDIQYRPVSFIVRDGRLHVAGRIKNGAAPEIGIAGAKLSGQPTNSVSLNREYVAKALRFGLGTIQIQDSLSVARFSKGGKQMIVVPLKPEQAAPAPTAAVPQKPSPQDGTAASPSAPPAEPPTETERKDMSQNTVTAPERGNLRSHPAANGEDGSAFKAVVEQIESIKTKLKETLSDLNEALALIKAAEKEKRLNDKEMESVRTTLRSLQKVQI
jgi:DNA polymerase III sliding clamp (beta) subunit (PCNA family)